MRSKILAFIKNWKCNYLLPVLFLIYIFITGYAAFPDCLRNIYHALQTSESPIQLLNSQYNEMLNMDKNTPAIHNNASYINLNGYMANLLDQPMLNEVVRLSNGHLSMLNSYNYPDVELQEIADTIETLYQKQQEAGKHFLFILTPIQIDPQQTLLPAGYEDQSNANADRLLTLLAEKRIPYLDIRTSMEEAGITQSEAFYITDHHWTEKTGLWVYQVILEKLHAMGAISEINTHYTDTEQFDFLTYENSFLGSSGRRTGQYYVGLDDFSLINPKFDHNIHVTIPDWDLDVEGTYLEVSYREDAVSSCENPDHFNDNLHSMYGWGDTPVTNWRNPEAPDQSKCMLIGDSFGNIPFSLLPLYFSVCDELDMRHYYEDFSQHHATLDPDILILEINIGTDLKAQVNYPFFSE